MSSRTLNLPEALSDYVRDVAAREPAILAKLRAETEAVPYSMMQITPEQGALMRLLIELTGARRTLEVGVYTGYSSLAVALALPPDGRILACDVNEEWTGIARRYWREAGVEGKIDLRLGPAVATLDRLLAVGEAGRFDFAFIDADKPNYERYYERCLELVRPGGLIAIDNVLWGGSVADPSDRDAMTEAIRALNRKLRDDARISLALVPIGDGLTLARKR
jgi:caffeoyl-CoA O-methyltransferase